MGFAPEDEIVVHIHPETGPWSYDPRFNREEWLEANPNDWIDPEAANTVQVEDEEDAYASWTNDALRAELTERGLDTDGKKSELVARLEADDAENQE